jgi:hypothetical protein
MYEFITPTKTPEQLRLDSLKANKDKAAAAVAAERQRQKVSKAQNALQVARQSAIQSSLKSNKV